MNNQHMKIALFSQPTKNKKEATHITISEFSQNLSKDHEVDIIYGRGIIDHLKNFAKKKKQYDIIHGFSAAPLLSLKVIIAKFLFARNAKTIYTLKSYSKKFLGSFYFSFLLNFVDVVTVPTKTMKKKLVKSGLRTEKIYVISSHINTKKFLPLDKKFLKEKYGYFGKNIVFYYGSTYHAKGSHLLFQVAPILKERCPNTIILIAPRDQPTPEYLALAQNESNITLITEEINVVDFVNFADVIVLPYISLVGTEGNPSCLLEAISCKTPVITTFQKEITEIFVPGEDLLMAKPGDVQDLASKIISLLENSLEQKKIVGNAYTKIDQFDIQNVTSQFEQMYVSLLSNTLNK